MKIQFISLGSGSSGNSYYLGTDSHGILIDAGVPARTIRKSLKDVGITLEEKVRAVFVTHDHADHIKALGTLANRLHLPVYTTAPIHRGINQSYCIGEKVPPAMQCVVEKEKPLRFRDLTITPFPVPHDAIDSVGYCVEIDGRTFSFLTDVGEITPTAARYIRKANYLVIEANYDEEMLAMGVYPQHLKERIKGPTGHLGNHDTARFLAENIGGHLRHIWLCHLSKENNHPELAYKTVELELRSHGVCVGKDVELTALRRTTPSELYEF
ncbi:MAG: MBL fold metallo-hydrolase [Bacteroidales bacterium]|nr:MBL fold metallo-hydrolase [Bacteroidales bacterium]